MATKGVPKWYLGDRSQLKDQEEMPEYDGRYFDSEQEGLWYQESQARLAENQKWLDEFRKQTYRPKDTSYDPNEIGMPGGETVPQVLPTLKMKNISDTDSSLLGANNPISYHPDLVGMPSPQPLPKIGRVKTNVSDSDPTLIGSNPAVDKPRLDNSETQIKAVMPKGLLNNNPYAGDRTRYPAQDNSEPSLGKVAGNSLKSGVAETLSNFLHQMESAGEINNELSKNKLADSVAHGVGNVMLGGTGNAILRGGMALADKYHSNLEQMEKGTSDISQGYQEEIKDATGLKKTIGDALSSTPQFLLNFIPYVGQATFFNAAMGGYSREAENEGANLLQQTLYGAVGGGIEAATEKIPVDLIKKTAIGKWIKLGGDTLLHKFGEAGIMLLSDGISEYIQEFTADPAANLAKKAIYKPDMPWTGEDGVWNPSKANESGAAGFLMGIMLGALGLPSGFKSNRMAKTIMSESSKITPEMVNLVGEQMKEDLSSVQTPQQMESILNQAEMESKVEAQGLPALQTQAEAIPPMEQQNVGAEANIQPAIQGQETAQPNIMSSGPEQTINNTTSGVPNMGQQIETETTVPNMGQQNVETKIPGLEIEKTEIPKRQVNNVQAVSQESEATVKPQLSEAESKGSLGTTEVTEAPRGSKEVLKESKVKQPNLSVEKQLELEKDQATLNEMKKAMASDGVNADFKVVKADTKVRKKLKEIGKGLGVEVVFYEGSENIPAGFVNNKVKNTIFIKASNDHVEMVATTGHEFLHHVRKSYSSEYGQLLDFAKTYFTPEAREQYLSTYNNYKTIQDKLRNNESELLEEMLADELGNNFLDKGFWQKVYEHSKELFNKLVKAAKELVDKFNVSEDSYETYVGEDISKNLSKEFERVIASVRKQVAAGSVDTEAGIIDAESDTQYSARGVKTDNKNLAGYDEKDLTTMSLERAVEKGLFDKKSYETIQAIRKAFPKAWSEHMDVVYSDQEFAVGEAEAKGTAYSKDDKLTSTSMYVKLKDPKTNKLGKDAKNVIIMFKDSNALDFVHQYGDFLYNRVLTGKQKGIVSTAHKNAGLPNSVYKYSFFGEMLEKYWLQGNDRIKGKKISKDLNDLLFDSVQSIKHIADRFYAMGDMDAISKELKPLINDIIGSGKEYGEKLQKINTDLFYTDDDVVYKYLIPKEADTPEYDRLIKMTKAKRWYYQGFSSNAKTGWSYDPSSNCPKKDDFIRYVLDYIDKNNIDQDMLANDKFYMELYDKAVDEGITVPCEYCYVEAARRLALAYHTEGAKRTGVNFAQAKQLYSSRPYHHEIMRFSKKDIAEMNKRGGLRIFSFSDYVRGKTEDGGHTELVKAVLEDAAKVGLAIKVITKQTTFVEDFGHYGINIQLSIDSDGQNFAGHDWTKNKKGGKKVSQGIPWDEAFKLSAEYENVVIRTLAKNIDEVKAYLDLKNPNNGKRAISVITPYHGDTSTFPGYEDLTSGHKMWKEMMKEVGLKQENDNVENDDYYATLCCAEGGKCFKEYTDGRKVQCATNCGIKRGNITVPYKNPSKSNRKAHITLNKTIDTSEVVSKENIIPPTSAEAIEIAAEHYNMDIKSKKPKSKKKTAKDTAADMGINYSTRAKEKKYPNEEKGLWKSGPGFDEIKAQFPDLFGTVEMTEEQKKHPTQVKNTVNTYKKIFQSLIDEGFKGTILDASSGLGLGTQAGRDMGMNIEDVEPYPDKDYHPMYTKYSDINKKYDYIISSAVLNVIPQDLRDNLVVTMRDLLKPDGRMIILTRGKDVENASSKIPIKGDTMAYYIAEGKSYQKGFKPKELKAYIEDMLGEGFTVETVNEANSPFKAGREAVVVTKNKKIPTLDNKYSVRSKEFKEWFAGSKIVDKKGNPLVVYHGTSLKSKKSKDFGIFNKGATWFTSDSSFANLFTIGQGRRMNGKSLGANIKPVYLKITNPIDISKLPITFNMTARQMLTYANVPKDSIDKIIADTRGKKKDKGDLVLDETGILGRIKTHTDKRFGAMELFRWFDSIAFVDALYKHGYDGVIANEDGHTTMATFKPNQIKSATGNSGEYSLDNDDIRYSVRSKEFKKWFGSSKVVDENGDPLEVYHGTASEFFSFDKGKRGDATGARSAKEGFFFTSSQRVADTYREGQYDLKPAWDFIDSLNSDQFIRLAQNLNYGGILYSHDADENFEYTREEIKRMLEDFDKAEGLDGFKDFVKQVNYLGEYFNPKLWQKVKESYEKGYGHRMSLYLKMENPLDIPEDEANAIFDDGVYTDTIKKAKEDGHDGVIFRDIQDAIVAYDDKNPPSGDIYIVFEPNQIKSATNNNGNYDANNDDIRFSVRSKKFKDWFGESKVLKEDGSPRIVYHGSNLATFTKFDMDSVNVGSLYGPGFYFTEDSDIASSYANSGNSRTMLKQGANEEERKEYFKKGRLVPGYIGWDRVLEYHPSTKDQGWYVEVISHNINTGKDYGEPRVHYTNPNKEEVYRILGKTTEAKGVLPVYLSIENPIDADTTPLSDEMLEDLGLSGIGEIARENKEHGIGRSSLKYGITLSDIQYAMSKNDDYMDSFYDLSDSLIALGYDGITHIGGNYAGRGKKEHRVWIAFEPWQIKSAVGNNGEYAMDNHDIRYSVRNKELKKWFGNSEVVDENGNPLEVYHGMHKDTDIFETNRNPKTYFFSSSYDSAKRFGDIVKSGYLKINKMFDAYTEKGQKEIRKFESNPKNMEAYLKTFKDLDIYVPDDFNLLDAMTDYDENWGYIEEPNFLKYLQSQGYDGFKVKEVGMIDGYGVFSNLQFKSNNSSSNLSVRNKEKKRKHIDNSMLNSLPIPEPLKEEYRQHPEWYTYTQISNQETLDWARSEIDNHFKDHLIELKKRTSLTSERDTALCIEIERKYILDGDYESAREWSLHVARIGTHTGRAIQYFSVLKRFTPEWTLNRLQKQIDEQMTDDDREKLIDTTTDVNEGLNEINEKAVEDIVDNLEGKTVEDVLQEVEEKLSPEGKEKAKEKAKKKKKKPAEAPTEDSTSNPMNEPMNEPTKKPRNEDRNEEVEKDPPEMLAKRIKTHMSEPKLREDDPIKMMVDTLYDVAKENLPQREKSKPRDPADFIIEAMKDPDYYREVWDAAKGIVQEKLKDNPEALDKLGEYFNRFLTRPFSEKQMDKFVENSLKEAKIDLHEIIMGVYSKDEIDNMLADALIDKGMDPVSAYEIEEYIAESVDKLTRAEKERYLKKHFGERKKSEKKEQDALEKIIELSNYGAFTNEKYKDLVAQKLGINVLTAEDVEKLIELSNKVQEYEEGTRERKEATARVLEFMESKVKKSMLGKIGTYQTLAMLLNPKTALRNVIGNLLFATATHGKDYLRTGIDTAISNITHKRTAVAPSLKTKLSGLKREGKEVLLDFAHDVNTAERGTKLELSSGKTFQKGILAQAERLARMILDDRPFKGAAYDDEIRKLKKLAELNGEEFNEAEAIDKAKLVAEYVTFQDTNGISSRVTAVKRALNNNKKWGIGDILIKFAKTPANVFARQIDYSPYSLIKALAHAGAASVNSKVKFNQEAFVDDLAKGVTGTAVLGLGIFLTKMGAIILGDDDDKDKRSLLSTLGVGQFKINVSALSRFLISRKPQKLEPGDHLASYDWAAPLSTGLTMGAAMANVGNEKAAMNTSLTILYAWEKGADTIFEMPFLQGIKTLESGDTVSEGIIKTLMGVPQTFVPTLSNQIRQMTDNTKRDVRGDNWREQIVNPLKNRIPGLSKTLPAKVNTLGEDEKVFKDSLAGKNNPYNVMINPSIMSDFKPGPGAKLVLDLFDATNETIQFPKVAPKYITFSVPDRSKYIGYKTERIDLTVEEYNEYQRQLGLKAMKKFNELAERKPPLTEETAKTMQDILTEISADVKEKFLKDKGYYQRKDKNRIYYIK